MKQNIVEKEVKEEERDIMSIFRRLRKRDFSGYTGIAIKNSTYQALTSLLGKGGSLLFTIIVARLLLPELFGLYSLALSTILIFSAFSALGISRTLIPFVSKELGKGNKKKAKGFIVYIGKIKFFVVIIAIIALFASAKFLSETYYQKPIFLALLAGSFYLVCIGAISFLESILQASNYFKGVFLRETLFQIARLILVPLAILLAISKGAQNEWILFTIISLLAAAYFVSAIFALFFFVKKSGMAKVKPQKLTKEQKRKVNLFIVPLSVMVLSGIFFSHIDTIMLGKFVEATFLGYYRAAVGLVLALTPLITFGTALLPVLSRMKGKRAKRALKKAVGVTVLLSILALIGTFLLASLIIWIVYGSAYAPSSGILKLMALLLITSPLIALYNSYLISQGKPNTVATLLVISTAINVILNYFFITTFLAYGQLSAVFGAGIATIISQYIYLFSLIILSKRSK